MTYNACNSGVSRSSWITRLTEEDKVQAVVLWHSCNPIIIINNSLPVQGNETGWYERMVTMDCTPSLLSCKLHEGDKATIKNKKRGDWHEDSFHSELCISLEKSRGGLDKAAPLNRLQLWLTRLATAVIATTKRNCKDWLTMNVDGSGSAGWHNQFVSSTPPKKSVTNHCEKHTSVLWCDNTMVLNKSPTSWFGLKP